MILATIQITALLFSALALAKYSPREGSRYRPGISFIASCWAGSCVALAVAMLLQWPEALDRTNGITAVLSGISAVSAWTCKGDVAELFRMFQRGLKWVYPR